MQPPPDRKELERDLHDHLRGSGKVDPQHNLNKKFYSISHLKEKPVRRWLTQRCRRKTVLDYCCGDGQQALWLAQSGALAYPMESIFLLCPSKTLVKRGSNEGGRGEPPASHGC